MLAIFPVFLAVGLFLPGFFIAKCFRSRLLPASAFLISLLVLFHGIFWLGIFGISITLWTVLPTLLALSGAAALASRRFAIPAGRDPAVPVLTPPERLLIWSTAAVGAVLALRSTTSPLLGGDTLFRWDFLAQRIQAVRTFNFYPPLTPADFRSYFFVDGIPPLVSFTNWWLYAAAGRHLPVLTCVLVVAQFACTLAFTYGAASALFSRRAGILAAAILASCPLYFNSVVLGQETGLTALSIAATLYFIVTEHLQNSLSAMVLAGMAAAVCALSREYGWIAAIAGVVAVLWRRRPAKDVLVFCAVALAVAGPWYARNWIRAGNPFYSLSFARFAVNPIHTGLLESYRASLGLKEWTISNWVGLIVNLVPFALIPVLAGVPALFKDLRVRGYLLMIACLLGAVWIQSIGYTSGGAEKSVRVLSPVLVVLSIAAAGLLEPLTRRTWQIRALVLAILLCQVWTAANGAVYPSDLLSLAPSQWLPSAFPGKSSNVEFEVRDRLTSLLPPGYRVLSDSAYLHAALIGKGIDVVPVWSPEVRFLFSSTAEESDRRLRELRIGSVVCYPKTLNMDYLVSKSPFYASLPERWSALAQVGDSIFILVPRNP